MTQNMVNGWYAIFECSHDYDDEDVRSSLVSGVVLVKVHDDEDDDDIAIDLEDKNVQKELADAFKAGPLQASVREVNGRRTPKDMKVWEAVAWALKEEPGARSFKFDGVMTFRGG